MKILVYAGEGVSSLSLQETLRTLKEHFPAYSVESICHKHLLEKPWEQDTALLVFPGGRDIPYDRHLRGKGTKKIRQYVENGGKFLGICAGAYFAAEEVIFEKDTSIEVHEKRDLGFFPGAAIGAVYGSFSYDSETGAHAAPLVFGDQTIPVYYNGGCYFDQAHDFPKTVELLAHYADQDQKAAIIRCQVGKGTALLSGVHFEVSPKALQKEGSAPIVWQTIAEQDQERQVLIKKLLSGIL